MAWMNWVCAAVVALGFVLFLYGANFYEATVGLAGIFFFVIGVVGLLVLYIYSELAKKEPQNP